MTKEAINEFSIRITQANTTQMVVVLYDIEISYLSEAIDLYKNNGADEFVETMKRAQKIHQELMSTLDFDNKIAFNIMELYLYVNKQIILSVIKQKPVNTEAIIRILKNLKTGFEEIAKFDHTEPLMKNTQQVYCGLTYGKGYLNESLDLSNMTNRGFQA